MYNGNQQQELNDRERGLGYNYNNSNNNQYHQLNENNQQQNYAPPNNPYLQNNNYNTTPPENNNACAYPQTGLNLSDADRGETRTEFILPESLKLGMILTSICCVLCFFVLLVVK